jgi:hypothetical protein
LNDIEPFWRPPSHLPSREAGWRAEGSSPAAVARTGKFGPDRRHYVRERALHRPPSQLRVRASSASAAGVMFGRMARPLGNKAGCRGRRGMSNCTRGRGLSPFARPSRLTMPNMDEKSIRGRALMPLTSTSLRADNLYSSWCLW